ncbi:MAG: hypothetical protein DWH97_08365 [Planctomycetota bacterium]|nr:MAG: hypothetical protein DWH97_08365 [Planctomycetota bacterium]
MALVGPTILIAVGEQTVSDVAVIVTTIVVAVVVDVDIHLEHEAHESVGTLPSVDVGRGEEFELQTLWMLVSGPRVPGQLIKRPVGTLRGIGAI